MGSTLESESPGGIELTTFFGSHPPAPTEAFRETKRNVPIVSLQRHNHRLTYHLNSDDSYTIILDRKQTLFWGNQAIAAKQFTLKLNAKDEHPLYADELKKIREYINAILKPLADKAFFGDAWNNPTLSFKKLKIAGALYKLLTDDSVENKCPLLATLFDKAAELQGDKFGEHVYPQGKLGSLIFNLRKKIDPEFRALHREDVKKLLTCIESAGL